MALETDVMKMFFWRALFILVPFLWSIYASSQPKKEADCSATCFSSEVVAVHKISATCTSYEIKVSYSGKCDHALSHFSVSVPCGDVQNLWNSQGWQQTMGVDPTTGLNGLKIDDIAGFGEGSLNSFTVKFTLCAENRDCAVTLTCWQPVVAYKASTCVDFQTLAVNCKSLKASIEKKDASCFGNADGSLSVLIQDGYEPYTFVWSNGAIAQNITGLEAGDYSVVVKDATGSEILLQENVGQNDKLLITGSVTHATCNGVADGSVSITVSGGSSPYSYLWSNGSDTQDISGVVPGTYSVIVSDTKGCQATASFTVASSSLMSIASTLVRPDCNGTNGSIDITPSGGSEPYTFAWSDGKTTEDLSNIASGVYTVKVTDANGCSQEKSFFIKDNNTLTVRGTTTPTTCLDDGSGAIDITVAGGSAPYTYRWSNGETAEDISGLTSGSYTVEITDSKGCTITAGYAISKTTFQVPRTVTQPTCYGDNNGSITLLEPIGGTAPFTYEWSNGATGPTLTDLAPGSYTVKVTDATGCSRTVTSTIIAPVQINATASVSNAACNADDSFSIDLNVTGGTAPYQYQWSNGSTAEDLNGLTQGSYTVVVTDAHGCSMTKVILVEGEMNPVSCLITQPPASPQCNSQNNTLTSPVTDADSYVWNVTSTDGSWSLSTSNAPSITYTAGNTNTSATFTLTITKGGCTQSCTYTTGTCVSQDSEDPDDEEPGEEEPGGEEPGGENPQNPGEENPGDGANESCDQCFETIANVIESSGGCRTYEMQISTNGRCRRELSHWTLSIPCGSVSNYWNSEGWKMEFGNDPTTGLYGLKVDDIGNFGNTAASFIARFTVCETTSCEQQMWDPLVAYKAGQCVASESISINDAAVAAEISVYPNPFVDVINFEWSEFGEQSALEVIDQYGNTVMRSSAIQTTTRGSLLSVASSSLPKGVYYYRLSIGGEIHKGKLLKR